jgi:hypothetical protein
MGDAGNEKLVDDHMSFYPLIRYISVTAMTMKTIVITPPTRHQVIPSRTPTGIHQESIHQVGRKNQGVLAPAARASTGYDTDQRVVVRSQVTKR